MSWLEITGIGTGIPTLSTDGVPLRFGAKTGTPGVEQGLVDGGYEDLVFLYRATVTAGQTATMSFLQLWLYYETGTDDWYPVGATTNGTDIDRGKLNAVTALAEIASDKIHLSQIVSLYGSPTRIYLREGTSGGSGYASTAFLVKGK